MSLIVAVLCIPLALLSGHAWNMHWLETLAWITYGCAVGYRCGRWIR